MARDLSCPSGKVAYKTKREVPEGVPMRCHRCRWWHTSSKKRKAKREEGHRG